MKTKVEINGYEIEIEENDGLIVVKAIKDDEDEVIEEFTIETEGSSESQEEIQGDEEIQGFGEFEGEEEGDFEGEEEGDFDEGDLEDEDEVKLESFQSFVNKKK